MKQMVFDGPKSMRDAFRCPFSVKFMYAEIRLGNVGDGAGSSIYGPESSDGSIPTHLGCQTMP